MATKKPGTVDVSAVLRQQGVSLKEEGVRALQEAVPRLLAAGRWVLTCKDSDRLVVVGSSMKRDELERRYGDRLRVVWNDHLVETKKRTTKTSERKSRKRTTVEPETRPDDSPKTAESSGGAVKTAGFRAGYTSDSEDPSGSSDPAAGV